MVLFLYKKYTNVNNQTMRKIFLFIIILLLVMFSFPSNINVEDMLVYSTTSGKEFLRVNDKILYEQKADIADIEKMLSSEDITGITIKIKGNIKDVLKKTDGKIVSKQKINNKNIFYVYSKKISGYTQIRKSNMQIVESGDHIIVGIPIIVGGF